tara:strand:+ start:1959 stop:2120 length:162 start_codon:yes stop_codon:yes gene_type:complete
VTSGFGAFGMGAADKSRQNIKAKMAIVFGKKDLLVKIFILFKKLYHKFKTLNL